MSRGGTTLNEIRVTYFERLEAAQTLSRVRLEHRFAPIPLRKRQLESYFTELWRFKTAETKRTPYLWPISVLARFPVIDVLVKKPNILPEKA
eukprot:scaffold2069_cov77-Skeletonema_dohrnii-CCMP3373.AAC.2